MKWRCTECGEMIDEGPNEWRGCATHAVEAHENLEGPTFNAVITD